MIDLSLFNDAGLNVLIKLPAIWNEFTTRELKIICNVLDKELTKQELLIRIIKARAADQKVKLPGNWVYKLNFEDAAINLLPLADHWLSNNDLTRQPVPKVGNFHGPAGNFEDLTCGEYEDADIHFVLFSIDNDYQHIVDLTAALWRPNAGNGIRVPYKDYRKPRITSFSPLKRATTLQMIYLWYSGCRRALMQLFPTIFTPGLNTEKSEPDVGAFTKLIHSGAGERNGSRDDIRNMPLKEFLFDCQLQQEAHDEMEAALKKK